MFGVAFGFENWTAPLWSVGACPILWNTPAAYFFPIPKGHGVT